MNSDNNSNSPNPDANAVLTSAVPQALQPRIQSLRLNEGIVTIVLDASGLDAAERTSAENDLRTALSAQPGVSEVRVAMMADKVRRKIIAVGSGKGGVGKSTLSANLAVALARLGHKVGLVDADIYGPSQARLLSTEDQMPKARGSKLIPVPTAYDVSMLSMGQMAKPGQAIAWRGPMVGNALSQMMEAEWGDADVLVVDLPPGTGDVQLTMLKKFTPDGAVIVSTPQDLALIDASRAMDLFKQANVPVIGMVENMAGYVCPHCGETSDPFGCGGAQATAAELGHAFLGRVPLDLTIRQDSDAGRPPAAGEGPQAEAFRAIAAAIGKWMEQQGR